VPRTSTPRTSAPWPVSSSAEALAQQRQDALGGKGHGALLVVAWEVEELAAVLPDFAAGGISHVQLIIDPVTPAGIASLAPILEALDAA
jgi:hypothetical protein